ncbi:MAG: hypothetical protein J7K96_03605, partial [Desulfobacteraceae bacterium]|nr:hypothetical protein [Desulfobacteraceae bacterium]
LLLSIEIERIRAEMNLMTDEVKELMKKKTAKLRLAKPKQVNPWQHKMLQIHSSLFPGDEAYG